MQRKLRIVYMGTPDFAVGPLEAILKSGYEVAAIITAPDKPAGRGQKFQSSAVKMFSIQHNLPILQPVKLKDPEFLKELKALNANLFVVVAFRMLPEQIWQMPAYGTLNLHASLLPQYRGAAPINHAIMNGETETGVTTFFIEKEIDTGKIILASKQTISASDNAGTLHDKLMVSGAETIIKTLELIKKDEVNSISQQDIVDNAEPLKAAPKIFKDDCRINWSQNGLVLYNFIRGLSPYPGAFTHLTSNKHEPRLLKLLKCDFESGILSGIIPGSIDTDNKSFFKIACADGYIIVQELQPEGKKRMTSSDFMRGCNLTNAQCI